MPTTNWSTDRPHLDDAKHNLHCSYSYNEEERPTREASSVYPTADGADGSGMALQLVPPGTDFERLQRKYAELREAHDACQRRAQADRQQVGRCVA